MNNMTRQPGETWKNYVARLVKTWEEQVGQVPLSDPMKKRFKQAMITGQTPPVMEEMEKLVGGGVLRLDLWIETLVHHFDRYDETKQKTEEETQKLKAQVMKEQLRVQE
ncbi:hypothetical protein ILYODFUR_025257 [Ilyodon furcidens]|uniref:Uncharacterized protein n=1 Tax=Ilyodon furcidens TaxID=33524 RepID=A0ABV0U9G8_9TELE